MSIEEEKSSNTSMCSNCQNKIEGMNTQNLGIEVTCGHEMCMKCILKAMPQE